MSTAAVTPDNGNPFNQPLDSEVQESAQRQAASQQASPNGNPFDEPLASEIADKKHADNLEENGMYVPNARIRNMTVDPTKDTHSGMEAFLSGAKTGAEAAAIPASAMGLGEAGPVIEHLAEHLPDLAKAYKVLKTVGQVGTGVGGATYTLQHLKDVLGVMLGKDEKKKK